MKTLDVPLLVATVALGLVGALVLQSVTGHGMVPGPELKRQGLAFGIGLVLMLGLSRINPIALGRLWLPMYGVGLGSLVLVRLVGYVSHGARRWVSLGPVGAVQPSEPMKLVVVVMVAYLLSQRREDAPVSPMRTLGVLALAAVPTVLVLAQPDMGTALVLAATTLVMLFVGGASPIWLLGLVVATCAAAPHFMHDYQRTRLLTFLNPGADAAGSGYNLLQARTAVGAGQWFGSGQFSGLMSQHGFVPENWTDYVFSVLAEEWGFVGCVGFLCLCAILVGCVVRTALTARDGFDMLLTTGVATMLTLHVCINVGMVVGLLPATGLPLPFVSYGGTAVLTQMAGLGLVLAVYRKRREEEADVWGLQALSSRC